MSTEHPYTVGTPQYDWILADLAKAAANRATVPWIILTGTSGPFALHVLMLLLVVFVCVEVTGLCVRWRRLKQSRLT